MDVITDQEARKNLAANLQRILDARDMTQTDLAERTSLSVMSISRMCREQQSPTLAAAARIAEALDVSIDRLIATPAEKKLAAAS